jgi:hypothetical protein
MQKLIEVAKSGRARCRGCRQNIAKDELRYGEEAANQFGDGVAMQWLHLPCAAKKHPRELKEAMDAYAGDIPNRAELEKTLTEAASSLKTYPFAEWAPTGRSKCLQCKEPIDKDTLRVGVEREIEMGGVPRVSPGYLHPQCAGEFMKDETLADKLKANSHGLKPDELDIVLQKL